MSIRITGDICNIMKHKRCLYKYKWVKKYWGNVSPAFTYLCQICVIGGMEITVEVLKRLLGKIFPNFALFKDNFEVVIGAYSACWQGRSVVSVSL